MRKPLLTIFSSPGFTLIELMISLAIIGLITGVIVFNQSDLTDQIALGNVASTVELQIREAQVYGISVREATPSTNSFSSAYGVDFRIGTGGSPTSFISFVDKGTVNGYYDTWGSCTLGSSECLLTNQITRGNTISRVCAIQSNNSLLCAPNVSRAAITFLRPNPAARIVFFNSAGSLTTIAGSKGAAIEISSPKNQKKTVYIYNTGQIAIQ